MIARGKGAVTALQTYRGQGPPARTLCPTIKKSFSNDSRDASHDRTTCREVHNASHHGLAALRSMLMNAKDDTTMLRLIYIVVKQHRR